MHTGPCCRRQRTSEYSYATSTLEIGVDIGDVDLVVLDGPPPDIPALLQRIGRGNRRSGTTRVMACAALMGGTVSDGGGSNSHCGVVTAKRSDFGL